jgi:hypothetical protein
MVTEYNLPTKARFEVYDKLATASILAFMSESLVDSIALTKAILSFQDFIVKNDMSDEDFNSQYYDYYETLISMVS